MRCFSAGMRDGLGGMSSGRGEGGESFLLTPHRREEDWRYSVLLWQMKGTMSVWLWDMNMKMGGNRSHLSGYKETDWIIELLG